MNQHFRENEPNWKTRRIARNFYLCEILEKNVFKTFLQVLRKCRKFREMCPVFKDVGEIFDFSGKTFVRVIFAKIFRPNSTSAWAATVGRRGSRRFSLAAASIGRPGFFTYQTRSGTSSTSCSRRITKGVSPYSRFLHAKNQNPKNTTASYLLMVRWEQIVCTLNKFLQGHFF